MTGSIRAISDNRTGLALITAQLLQIHCCIPIRLRINLQ
jgi:hypothetical protein